MNRTSRNARGIASNPGNSPSRLWGLCFGATERLSPARRRFCSPLWILAFLSVVGFHYLLLYAGYWIHPGVRRPSGSARPRPGRPASRLQPGYRDRPRNPALLVPGRPPDVPGVDIAFVTRPAKTVGGDCYDVFRRATDGPLLIAVADVSGKERARSDVDGPRFRLACELSPITGGSLSELVAGLNRQLCANSQHGRFTTAFLAEMDPATGDLSYLARVSNPPILKREDGSFGAPPTGKHAPWASN